MTRPTHTIPTHLRQQEHILSLGLFGVSTRQLLQLIITGALAYQVFTDLAWLAQSLPGMLARVLLLVLIVVGMLVVTFGRVQGQGVDRWLLQIVQYQFTPRRFIWHSLRWAASDPAASDTEPDAEEQEEGQAHLLAPLTQGAE